MNKKGKEREANIDKGAYYSEHYFQLPQLASFAHQIHEINKLKPKNILEIGPGNGFTSLFLRQAGYDVTTVDINPVLKPDICAPLNELERHLQQRTFDLVVCCEVLEHLPYEEFSASIGYLKAAGERLFLTLPNYARTFGIGGFLRLPKVSQKELGLHLEVRLKKKLADGPHFWEVGYEKRCTRGAIRAQLLKNYNNVNDWKFVLNPYHVAFYCH